MSIKMMTKNVHRVQCGSADFDEDLAISEIRSDRRVVHVL
jgi:hypothetical protein